MQNPESAGRSVLIQTTLRVTEGEDEELIVVSDRGCQTVTTISPDVETSQIVPLLEYTPYSEIVNNSIKVYDLPKKYQIQFELPDASRSRSKNHSLAEGALKGALKKSSDPFGQERSASEKGEDEVETEEGSRAETGESDSESLLLLNIPVDYSAMKKAKLDQDCQTDLTVIPPVLEDDAIANVCTQLGVQTSLTFQPNDSLTTVTPELKKYLSHTGEYQALVVDGKIVHGRPEDEAKPTDEEETKTAAAAEVKEGPQEEEGEDRPPAAEADVKTTEDVAGAPIPEDAKRPKDVQGYQLAMTEEEFERNVQRILDNTVKNVYDFMAKIVEIYEKSKDGIQGEEEAHQTVPVEVIARRRMAVEYIEKVLQGEIPKEQFKITERPGGSRHYEIMDGSAGRAIHVEEAIQIMWPSSEVLPSGGAEGTSSALFSVEPGEDQVRHVLDLVERIHKKELSPSNYTETWNPDGTVTFVVTVGEVRLKVIDFADIVSLKETPSVAEKATGQHGLSVKHMWQVHQAQARDVRGEVDLPTEWERADPRTVEPSADSLGVDAGAPTGQEVAAPDETPSGDLEADAAAEAEVRPATAPEEAEAAKTTSQPPSLPMAAPIIEIGDTQSVQRRPREIECECGRVHDGGAAPPLLSIGEKKLTLEFKVGGPKVMERMVDSLKVKATISGTNKCAQKDQTIVVSFNVSDGAGGAAPARPVCECVSEATSFASPKRAARDADSCSCSLASEKMTYDSDSIAKSLECVCWDAPKTDGDVCSCGPTTQDKQTGGATATKKCGPECGGITNKARVTSALCQALRERLTERPQTTQKVCRCGRTHSVACVAKVREEIGDGCPCKRRIESKGTSAPRMCETSVQRVMECLKQQSFKDPEQLDRHLKGLQPLLRRLEGVSLQSFRCSPTSHSRCVCVSSVQVIYKKSDETRSPGPPVVLPVNETCICDLCHGGDATPLFQEEDEYREAYFDVGEEGRAPAKGVSSLPEVVNETDGCPRRTELPWLTMTLPPPGSIRIGRQPKKPCACKKKEKAATVDRIIGCCVCPEEGKVRPEEVPCACTVTKRPDESCYCRTLESPTLPCTCDCPPSKPAVSEQYSAPKVPPEAPTQTTQSSGHDVTCPCYRPCPELKPTKLLYDDLNYATNEEYMDPLYKMFPDESESPCGAATEINWADYVLPTNVRLMTREKKRGKKKQPGGTTTVASQTSRTTDQSRRSTRAPSSSSPAKTPVPIQDSSTSRQTQADSMVQLELNFSGYTEIISTLMPVEDGAVEQHTVSEFSAITDITRTIRRMDSNRVRTVLADGEAPSAYGIVPTVGSQPFGIAGDATRGDFLTFVLPPPAPQVAPSPEMPERVSDLIKLISLEPPAVGGASQKPSTLSAGPRRPRSPARTRPTTAPLPADLVIITSVDTEPVGLGEKSPAAKKRSASSGGSKRTREVGINCGKPACEGTRKPRGPETASVSFTASPCKSPLQEAESECSLDRVASPILAAIRTVEREMKPLHDTLNELRAKIQTMDIPELENWSQRASCTSCQKKAPYGGGPQQVNLFVQDVPGPFRREPPPKRCVCLESVDDDYVPTGMRDVVDETMGLDRMVKQSVKPAPIKKSRDDLKDYMRAVERTMALDRMIRREFKARATQSESSINRTYKKQSPKQRTSGTNKCASSELNAKKNRQPYPAEWTYYPYMIDWFYQQHMYNSYLYSYYYYPEYIFGFSRTNTVVCRETKGRSSASSSESTSRSYSSVCSSERSSYPSSRFTGSTDDDEDPDFTRVFKAGESVVASVSKEERRELKITLKATRSGRTTSGGEEVYSSSS